MSILSKGDVHYLIGLLPHKNIVMPSIYLFEQWKDIHSYTMKRNVYREYQILKHIVKNKIFSIYNYQYQSVFLYMFNLPYDSRTLKVLHSIFCLYHELRHHEQYTTQKARFLHNLPEPGCYHAAWTEEDANEFAAEWLLKNRTSINQRFGFRETSWEIGILENRLRVYIS
ncbi:hypothetical protein [Peribacillus kribbensis]|uniref:hypothetical protein n=1 Tax=Peribacillus kribbensis TaxID=356658 RepID=UPI0004162CDF|nr:hypothetical protein [Peribacillus kribbensis]